MADISISAYSDRVGIRKNLQQLQIQINTNFVPYTGAISNVNLGAYDLSATDLTSTSLTGERLVASDSNDKLVSSDLINWISGTSGEIDVADDGDGSVTISAGDNVLLWVTPPTAYNSPGAAGQVAYDGYYFYWHNGTRWLRTLYDSTEWTNTDVNFYVKYENGVLKVYVNDELQAQMPFEEQYFLLNEDGSYLLTESDGRIVIE